MNLRSGLRDIERDYAAFQSQRERPQLKRAKRKSLDTNVETADTSVFCPPGGHGLV